MLHTRIQLTFVYNFLPDPVGDCSNRHGGPLYLDDVGVWYNKCKAISRAIHLRDKKRHFPAGIRWHFQVRYLMVSAYVSPKMKWANRWHSWNWDGIPMTPFRS